MGLLVNLDHLYEIKSNREAGYGRYDLLLVPREEGAMGIVIELKKPRRKESLEQALEDARQQLAKKNYEAELRHRGVEEIAMIALAV